ncbi:MAG: hypothetical protein IT384_16220 [Deltaproteobacteria bacterium]|nr:hypothetical protein [Deltaproteobacteria bacterium]
MSNGVRLAAPALGRRVSSVIDLGDPRAPVPAWIAGYRTGRRLGVGAMGAVLEAWSPAGQRVALKVDSGEAGGLTYVAMEYIESINLDHIRAVGPLDSRATV